MNDRKILVEYAYRPKRVPAIFMACFLILGAIFMVYMAINLEQPPDNGMLKLSAKQGRILFGVIAALSPIGIVLLLAWVRLSYAENRRVALTDKSILMPHHTRMGNSCEEIEIPFSSIKSTSFHSLNGKDGVFRIYHSDGFAPIVGIVFLNKSDFPDFRERFKHAFNSFEKQAANERHPSSQISGHRPCE